MLSSISTSESKISIKEAGDYSSENNMSKKANTLPSETNNLNDMVRVSSDSGFSDVYSRPVQSHHEPKSHIEILMQNYGMNNDSNKVIFYSTK